MTKGMSYFNMLKITTEIIEESKNIPEKVIATTNFTLLVAFLFSAENTVFIIIFLIHLYETVL